MPNNKLYLYASNVFHYEHVIASMQKHADKTTLIRRYEPSPKTIQKLQSTPLPAKLLTTFKRRAVERTATADVERTFGPQQFIIPISHHLGRRVSAKEYRFLTRGMATTVARKARGHKVVQFVEGLGHKSLTQRVGDDTLYICERRGNHPATWDHPRPVELEMPHTFNTDPIRDILEAEFEGSDRIIVYSNAAKRTFIENQVPENKIRVLPLPIPPLMPPIPAERNPRQLLFVGRGVVDKGLDVAVAAVSRMPPGHQLVVAGPMTPEVIAWLRKFPFVKHIGPQTKIQLRKLYSESSALILPSMESFGFVLIEAIHHGLTVICSVNTGAAEYVQSPRLRVQQGFDPKEWSETILQAIEPPENGSPDLSKTYDAFEAIRPKSVLEQWSAFYQ